MSASSPQELLERCTFPPPSTAVTLGVSGGADSSALLVLAVAAGCEVTAVHVDHGLRPDSAREADVVEALAQRFGCAFVPVKIALSDGPNLEARARQARYEALGLDALVGHTLDDRAETVLFHLLRGTGAAGLAAMCPPDPRRPLLRIRRTETVALCERLGIAFIQDATNADPRFTRNRIRHELVPLCDEIAGRDTAPMITRAADLIAADTRLLDELADVLDPQDAPALAAAPGPLATRALRKWLAPVHDGYASGSAEIERVMAVAKGTIRATEVAGGHRVARTKGRLRVESDASGIPRQDRSVTNVAT